MCAAEHAQLAKDMQTHASYYHCCALEMKAVELLHKLHAMRQLLRLCTQCLRYGICCCRDFACAASDHAAHAARLASIDTQRLGFNSSTSAYVQYAKVDEHVQVGADGFL